MQFIVMDQNMLDTIIKRLDRLEECIQKSQGQKECYYTIPQTMKLLSISRKTLQLLRDRRQIAFIQFGKNIRFRRSDIEAFCARNHLKTRF